MYKKIIYIIIIFIFLIGCGQQSAQNSNTDNQTDESLLSHGALVTFKSGEVLYINPGDDPDTWDYLEIGYKLDAGTKIMVAEDSICELQFGDVANIRIKENTEIVLTSDLVGPGSTDVAVENIVGTILCKVDKLTGNDSFRITTSTSVCGVRGTQFQVTVEQQGTELAVKEGKVAIIPSDKDIKDILDVLENNKDNKNAEEIRNIINTLNSSIPIVKENEEIFISAENTEIKDKINESIKYIEEIIRNDISEQEISIAKEKIEAINTSIENNTAILNMTNKLLNKHLVLIII